MSSFVYPLFFCSVAVRITKHVLLKVLFSRGRERHELWTILLEKAFAKAHGCYENIMHG